MPKITKHAEFLDTLRGMVTKEGSDKSAEQTKEANQPTASGVPGKDTHPEKVPESTEHVNKNEQGHPEKNPQDFKQEKAKDAPLHAGKKAEDQTAEEKQAEAKLATPPNTGAAPVAKDAPAITEQKVHKKADDATENMKLAELGEQLLKAIQGAQTKQAEQTKEANKPEASGKPGKDTNPASMGSHTDKVNKNEQGHPEKLEQDYGQHPGKDGPLHGKAQNEAHASGTKAAEQTDIDKQASFELGRQFCRSFLQTKVASQQDMYKTAGRRDFETLIAQAAAELDTQSKQAEQVQAQANQKTKQASALYDEQFAEKQAEEAGAQAFYAMMKQAQDEYQAEQVKLAFEQQLNAVKAEKVAAEKKAAELEAALKDKEAAIQKKAEEEKRASEFHTWGNYVVEQVLSRLQSEPAR